MKMLFFKIFTILTKINCSENVNEDKNVKINRHKKKLVFSTFSNQTGLFKMVNYGMFTINVIKRG